MISFSLTGMDDVQAWLAAMPDKLNASVVAQSQILAQALIDKVDAALSGGVLETKSGRLKGSIGSETDNDGTTVTTSVFAGDDVPYAAIQEYGGQTKAHVIEAINAKALAFKFQGKNAFFTHVNHPGSNIPARSYLGSSMDEMEAGIVSGMSDAAAAIG